MPALVDGDTTGFDSSAILLYLAEKTGQFLSKPASRGEMLSWLMLTASGIGPVTGQCVHFKPCAPETLPYALNRCDYEAWRHWRLIGQRAPERIAAAGPTRRPLDHLPQPRAAATRWHKKFAQTFRYYA